jgi:hypothetical protein
MNQLTQSRILSPSQALQQAANTPGRVSRIASPSKKPLASTLSLNLKSMKTESDDDEGGDAGTLGKAMSKP